MKADQKTLMLAGVAAVGAYFLYKKMSTPAPILIASSPVSSTSATQSALSQATGLLSSSGLSSMFAGRGMNGCCGGRGMN